LLLAAMALLTLEWVRTPALCERVSSGKGEVAQCGTMAAQQASHSCCKSPAQGKEHKNRGCGVVCFDCPLCYLVTFQPFFQFEILSLPDKKDYAMMPVDHLSDYFRRNWKPPNLSFQS
jgi:hypothetical protein